MKKTTKQKLALKREIIRKLTQHDLGRVVGGTREDEREHDPRDCWNPIYSA